MPGRNTWSWPLRERPTSQGRVPKVPARTLVQSDPAAALRSTSSTDEPPAKGTNMCSRPLGTKGAAKMSSMRCCRPCAFGSGAFYVFGPYPGKGPWTSQCVTNAIPVRYQCETSAKPQCETPQTLTNIAPPAKQANPSILFLKGVPPKTLK